MSCKAKEYGQYIVEWCVNWARMDKVVTYKFLDPTDRTYEYTTDYNTYITTQPVGWSIWPCNREYDTWIFCEWNATTSTLTGNKIQLVVHYNSSWWPISNYYDLSTWAVWSGNPETELVACPPAP